MSFSLSSFSLNLSQYHKKFNYVPQIKSDGQEKSTKLFISWQELKNEFLSFFVHRKLLGR